MQKDPSLRPTPRKKNKTKTPKAAPAAKAPKPKAARTSQPKASAGVSRLKAGVAKAAKTAKPTTRATKGSATGQVPGFLGKVAEGGARTVRRQRGDDPRERRQRYQRGQVLKMAAAACGCLVVLALAGLIAYFALRNSSVFEITSVEAEATEHLTVSDIGSLTQVPVGSTLLNVDTDAIEEALKKNPWVASVNFERVFPHTLKINVVEQDPDMLVVMSSGSVGWYLGDAGTWIQPTKIESEEGESTNDAALRLAEKEGCLLVTDVPATIDPVAGSEATDESIAAVNTFRESFSPEFSSQIVCFFAPSAEDISCMLSSGVQVSLGSATDIDTKESIVTGFLEEYGPGKVTAINVRVPSEASVKPVGSDNVQAGDESLDGSDGMGESLEGSGLEGSLEGSDLEGSDGSDGSGEGMDDGSDTVGGSDEG